MQTRASVALGALGSPLVRERAEGFLPGATGTSAGEMFAREIERANERERGSGLRAQRLDELESERRADRRAGFGQEREPGSDERPAERPRAAPGPDQAAVDPPSVSGMGNSETYPSMPEGATSGETAAHVRGPVSQPEPEAFATRALQGSPGAPTVVLPGVPGATGNVPSGSATTALTPRAEPAVALPDQRPQTKNAPAATATARPDAGVDPARLERAGEILRQLRLHLGPHVRRLTLDLEPAELGRISIQLALRRGRVETIVRAERQEVLELLALRTGELRELFASRGIGTAGLRFELGFGGRGAHDRAGRPAPGRAPAAPVTESRETRDAAVAPARLAHTLLDTYA